MADSAIIIIYIIKHIHIHSGIGIYCRYCAEMIHIYVDFIYMVIYVDRCGI